MYLLVSVLFSEPKIPQCRFERPRTVRRLVSVLFSEPKIPQFSSKMTTLPLTPRFQCSSASRKFLNSASGQTAIRFLSVSVLFSEPKIPQLRGDWQSSLEALCFSALQRAENSSIVSRCGKGNTADQFQCSSASRKFLNQSATSS